PPINTHCEIVEEARSELPSDSNLDYACVYTKQSQELLANASASCPKAVNKRDKFMLLTHVTKKKRVTFADPLETSGNNTPKHVKQQSVQPTNVLILPSTGVNTATIASGSKPRSNTKKDKTLPAKSVPKKKVEDHPRNNKSKLSKKNRVDSFDMADANINAPEVPADADSPPTRSDEQILPCNKWVPVGKSNCFLDVERSQANPIFKIVVDILKNTNFFNAFTASSTIPSIYIQQALATIINLCLTGKTSAFERPRAPVLQILWGVVNKANIDYAERIWEEFTQCIHSFTKDKMNLALHTEGKKKVNQLVISGVRFTKLIINHLKRKHKFHKRPGSPLHLPTEESALGYLKFSFKNTKRVRFGMAISDTLFSEEIRSAPYYPEYVAKVTKYQRYLAGEVVSDDDAPAPKPAKGATTKTTRKPKPQSSKTAPVAKPAASKTSKSTSSQPSKPTPAPAKPQEKKRKLVVDTTEAPPQAKRAKAGKVLKKRTLPSTRQLVDEFVDEGVPDKEPMYGDEEADTQRAIEESLKEVPGAHGGPLPPVVFREPDTGKFQPLPEVPGKGKEKVGEEQAAQVLLNLQTPKKKNPAEQFIFQRRTPAPTIPSSHEESSSLYAELGLTDSETDSDNEVSRDINPKAHIEGQAGSDPGKQVEAQAGSDPGVDADSQLPPSHVVHAGPNLEHMNLEVTDTSSQPNRLSKGSREP
ncbi:hypothetical protein Tco_0909560, partial [Tanacetum coccineum]